MTVAQKLADRTRGLSAWNHTAEELAAIKSAVRNGYGLRLNFLDGSTAFIPAGTAQVQVKGEMARFNVEYTDTYGGEANYCWVNRAEITVPRDASNLSVMRAAKAALGLSGVRGVTSCYGDMYEFRPYGMATVMFVNYAEGLDL